MAITHAVKNVIFYVVGAGGNALVFNLGSEKLLPEIVRAGIFELKVVRPF